MNSFRMGFRIGYEGDREVKLTSKNLKFRGIGNERILWNKVMKEVKLKRYAGPFKEIPFEFYIQSPIGLVDKDNGRDTRLIFHLSYPRNSQKSVNANTPKEKCSVIYSVIWFQHLREILPQQIAQGIRWIRQRYIQGDGIHE